MEPSNECPSADRLQSMLVGRIAGSELSELAKHIGDCQACQRQYERLASAVAFGEHDANDDSHSEVGNAPDESLRASDSNPELQRVMQSLIDQGSSATEIDGTSPTTPSNVDLSFLRASRTDEGSQQLGVYEISEVIGQGGMGIVLRGLDPRLNRFVAIKVLHNHLASNTSAKQRFLREARAAAAVSHDHVVTIHAVEEADDMPFIVMEYIAGRSLQERVEQAGPMQLREILRIGMQTAAGLAAAHAQGLVHRDIKPANILLENGVERVKITDFGLARALDDVQITQEGVVAGTPEFMSPEQTTGETVSQRSDLFSLGSVLYFMCTGRSPFRGSSLAHSMRRVCEDTPRPIVETNPDIPDWLIEIIDRLLEKSPDARLQSADEVVDLLGGHLAHLQQPTVSLKPHRLSPTDRPTSPRTGTRTRLGTIVGVAALALAAVAVGLHWFPGDEGKSSTTADGNAGQDELKNADGLEEALRMKELAPKSSSASTKVSLLERASELFERHGDKVNAEDCLTDLARAHLENWDFAQAIDANERAIATFESAPHQFQGIERPGFNAHNLAKIYSELGDISTETEYLLRMLDLNSQNLPPGHRNIQFARFRLAEYLAEVGKPEQALSYWQALLPPFQKAVQGKTPPIWGQTNDEEILAVLLAFHRPESNDEDLEFAREVFEKLVKASFGRTYTSASRLAAQTGEYDIARDYAQRACSFLWTQPIPFGTSENLRFALQADRWRHRLLRDLADFDGLKIALKECMERRDKAV